MKTGQTIEDAVKELEDVIKKNGEALDGLREDVSIAVRNSRIQDIVGLVLFGLLIFVLVFLH